MTEAEHTSDQRLAALEKQVKILVAAVDECRRRMGLSAIVDPQLEIINSRIGLRTNAN